MSRIHYSFLTGHIDLDKIIRISDAHFVYTPRGGGPLVRFIIEVQLRDQPIEYVRGLTLAEDTYDTDAGYRVRLVDGGAVDPLEDRFTPQTDYLCVANLQADIDRLIAAWKGN